MTMKKLWLLAAFAVLMSLSTGMVLGHWNDAVNINSQVTTGIILGTIPQGGVMYQLDGPTVNGVVGNDPYLPTIYNCSSLNSGVQLQYAGKNVANCSMSSNGETLTITLDNVYPGYYNDFDFKVYNSGTVPMYVSEVIVGVNNVNETIIGIYNPEQFLYIGGVAFADMLWGGSVGALIPAGESQDTSFGIHFLEGCPQGSNIVVQLELVLVPYITTTTGTGECTSDCLSK
jgi:hypothetical protein